MKKQLSKRMMALCLSTAMTVTLMPTQVFAQDSKETSEKASVEADGWEVQRQGEDTNVDLQDGWIVPDEDGNGVTIDYGKIIKDTGEQGWVVFDGDEPQYKNSSLEYDITFTDSEDGDWIAVAPTTRVTDGKNYEGFAITEGEGLERTGRINGTEDYGKIDNMLGMKFEYDKTYHLRMETIESNITVYVMRDGKEEKLASFASPIGLEESTYGFRFWRGGKKVKLDNIERKEIITSSLDSEFQQVVKDEWGKSDVFVPIHFGKEDTVSSIINGEMELKKNEDYEVTDKELILKKEYIASQNNNFQLKISFEKGSSASLWVVKYEPSKVQEYIWTPDQGIDMWESIAGDGTYSLEKDGMRMIGENILINKLAPTVANGEIELIFELFDDDGYGGMGSVFRTDESNKRWQGVANVDGREMWGFIDSDGSKQELINDGSTFLSRDGVKDYKLKMRYENDSVTIWMDDQFMTTSEVSQMEQIFGGMGLYLENGSEILLKKATFREVIPMKEETGTGEAIEVKNDGLTVKLDREFPRVQEYELNGKKLDGSRVRYNYVSINTVNIPATAEIVEQNENSVRYHVTPDKEKTGVTFDVVFSVKEGQILEMLIQNIEEPDGEVVNSISLPRQPLISASSSQEGAALEASWINGTASGFSDVHETIREKNISMTADRAVTIPIISANGLSASMFNNVYIDRKEYLYRAFELADGEVSAGFWNNDFMYRGLDGKKILPFESEPEENDLYCRVVITEDTNGDKEVNWQDGANALKKLTDGIIPGSENAARRFFHVGYNFASGVQQPFLKVADNMKRLSNYMDEFEQNLIFKGYNNEGHDSGHADYDDINQRAGGEQDMNVAIAEADKINSDLGIHLNVMGACPEAKMFNWHTVSPRKGWAWMDQAYEIRRDMDMIEGSFDKRLNSLFQKVPNLDFVYVDCWWGCRWDQLKLIGGLLRNGVETFGTENGKDMNRFNTWVHSTETSGSSIHHFVYHTQKDVYDSSPIYWGGYNRGASMMSWQHNNNINTLVEQFYTNQLPQKYLMCHEVLKQTDDSATFEGNVTSGNWVITKDGNKITDGQSKIFIPWYAEDSETKNPDEAAKIYHWNSGGGETTWTLPESWSNLKNVYLYQTTQNGKKLVDTIKVTDGQVTINAEAKTPYVVYPGEAKADETEWSVGSPLKDTGFNSRDFSIWEKSGDADIQFNDDGNGVSILTMKGKEEGSVSQTMTGLVPGQKYRLVVEAGSSNGKTARLTVKTPDGEVHENYVDQVVMDNQYFDNYAKGKKVQRMWVDFVQPQGETTAKVTLSADACESTDGVATFMETRIIKTAEPDLPEGYVANETFEYVEQGAYGIFNPERSADGAPHLSETHLPYTDDTISGDWSLKMYGMNGQGDVTVRTSPSTVRLMPETTYELEFDTTDSGKVYVQSESDENNVLLSETFEGGHSKYTFTTGDKKDYVVRIEKGKVLDNFTIKESIIDKAALEALILEAKSINQSDYTVESVNILQSAIEKAEALLVTEPDEKEIKDMYSELKTAIDGLVKVIDGYERIEFENADSITKDTNPADGKGTQPEAADDGIVMSFTFDGAWYQYQAVKFDNIAPTKVSVRYTGSDSCYDDARVEVRLGDKDGELIAIVDTPPTGGWDYFTTVTTDIDQEKAERLKGTQTICFVLRGTRENDNNYAGNFNWVEFTPGESIVVDKSDLAALITYTQEQQKNEQYQEVVPAVKEKLEKALAEAVKVNEDANATQKAVDDAYDALLEMVHYLDFTGSSDSLKVLVDVAKGLNEKLYTEESWAVFVDALAEAEKVLANENALQGEIDAARDALQTAMDALVKVSVDKTKLQKLVDDSKKYEEAIQEYTPATAEIFTGALANARNILAKEDATQEEIDAAYAQLQNAVFGLRLIPDKSKLEDLIQDAEKVDTSKYTEESANAFTAALNHAKEVFANENATEEDVKAAEEGLKVAKENLVAKADEGNSGTGNDNNQNQNDNNNQGTNKGSDTVKTGDQTSWGVYLMIAVLAVAAGGILVLFRRRKRS